MKYWQIYSISDITEMQSVSLLHQVEFVLPTTYYVIDQ